MSHNDDFWSGSQNDPYGGQPSYQGGYRQPPTDPTGAFPGIPPRPQGQPGHFDDSWGPHDQPDPRQFDRQYGGGGGPFLDSFGGEDWEQDDFEARRGGRARWVAAFIGAALLVALAAGAYAVYSVLGDSPGLEAISDSTTTLPSSTTAPSSTTTTASTLPPGMNIQLSSDQFVCNNEVREFGLITGANPNEEIGFSSPQSPNLSSGQADEFGRLPIRWSCTADQVGTTWELTATGAASGLSATTSFTGVPEGTVIEEQAITTTTPAPTTVPAVGELAVTLSENPFSCDGQARDFGTITGATPNGQITFTSPQASGIRPGTADESGTRVMRWVCSPDQSGTVWDLTATDDETGRSISFKLSGQ